MFIGLPYEALVDSNIPTNIPFFPRKGRTCIFFGFVGGFVV